MPYNYGTSYTYNLNGDILRIVRYGARSNNSQGIVDNIYNNLNSWSNQLTFNTEYGDRRVGHKRQNTTSYSGLYTSYGYDANGNLTYDGSKYLTTTYNHLNLPSTMRISGKGTITTIYDAAGRKWQKNQLQAKYEIISAG